MQPLNQESQTLADEAAYLEAVQSWGNLPAPMWQEKAMAWAEARILASNDLLPELFDALVAVTDAKDRWTLNEALREIAWRADRQLSTLRMLGVISRYKSAEGMSIRFELNRIKDEVVTSGPVRTQLIAASEAAMGLELALDDYADMQPQPVQVPGFVVTAREAFAAAMKPFERYIDEWAPPI